MPLKKGASPRPFINALRAMLMLSSLSLAPLAHGNYLGDLIVFPEATVVHRHGEEALADQEKTPAVNFLYTAHANRLRIVAEYVFSSQEQEVERFQVGWLTAPVTTLWVGRFHTPSDYWNITHHHGAYLQTSISRPSTALFEDEGILPQHISGVFWDSEHWVSGHTINYLLAAGVGPQLTPEGFDSLDILKPNEGDHRPSFSAALSLQPYESLLSTVGVFGTHTDIPSSRAAVRSVTQWSLGMYAAAQFDRTRIITSLLHLSNEVRTRAGDADEGSFFTGYAQAEYTLGTDWIMYGRVEGTHGGRGDAYLNLFPDYVRNRTLAGVRYELSRRQALKLELSAVQAFGQRYQEAAFQWSAVFP